MPLDFNSVHCAALVFGDKTLPTGVVRVIGTGFVLTVESETVPGLRHPSFITAHHNINGVDDIHVAAAHPRTGEFGTPIPVTDWHQPLKDADLAIAPCEPESYMHIALEKQVIADREQLRKQELFPGSPIHYIGILAPLNRIMARSGTVGALDQAGLPLRDEEMDRDYDYPAHLVDCRSYNGFSGSPCFVELSYADLTPTTPVHPLPEDEPGEVAELRHASMLCGMFTMHISDEGKPTNREAVVARYGVGVMLRSEEIRKALMTQEMRDERRDRDAKHKAAKPGSPGLTPARGETSDEFERFEELTDKLAKVPKKELDEKRKQP